MKRHQFSLAVCCWCVSSIGVIVTVSTVSKPAGIGALLATIAAITISIAATSEYRQP